MAFRLTCETLENRENPTGPTIMDPTPTTPLGGMNNPPIVQSPPVLTPPAPAPAPVPMPLPTPSPIPLPLDPFW